MSTAMPSVAADRESQLLAAAQAGDARALEQLIQAHQAQVYRFGMKMCRDPEDAKDVVQETLLALARGIQDFKGNSSVSTWLYSVARNQCLRKQRKSKFAPHQTSLEDEAHGEALTVADPSKPLDDAVAAKQVEVAVEDAMNELAPKYREVLVLRDVEGLSAKQVAEVLGISEQAVKSRLHRARVEVRDRVAPLLELPVDAPKAAGTCPDVLNLFSRHLEDEISADVCQEMERHLAACPRCRSVCDSLKRTLLLCKTTGAQAQVPPAIQGAVKRALHDFLRAPPAQG